MRLVVLAATVVVVGLCAPFAEQQAYAGDASQAASADPVPAPPRISEGRYRYFPETAHFLRGVFLEYWETHGALPILGLPITEPFMENGLAVQYLERARLEWHPEIADPAQRVLLGRLGAILVQARRVAIRPVPAGPQTPGSVYFPQTGHNLSGVFLDYWKANGGIPVFGYPLTEQIRETNPADGREYDVQYFERNRFEYHPERDAAHNVELGLLGVEYARAAHLNPLARVLLPEPVPGANVAFSESPRLSRLVDADLMPAMRELGRTPQFRWVPALIISDSIQVAFADVGEPGLAGAFAITPRPNRPYVIAVDESVRGASTEALASIIAHEATHAYDYTTGVIAGRLSCSIEEESRAYMNGLSAWVLLKGSDALAGSYPPGSLEEEINNSLRGFNGGKPRLDLAFSPEEGRRFLRTLYGAGCGR